MSIFCNLKHTYVQRVRLPRKAALFTILATTCLSLTGLAAQKLPDQVPAAVGTAKGLGHMDPAAQLDLIIGLPVRDEQILTNFLEQLYELGSPYYRQFLTSDQFTAAFASSESDYAGLIAFAETNGFTVTARHENRLMLNVRGSVATIEKTFNVRLNKYQHPREARVFYAPDTEPALNLSIPVLHITGLDNFTLPRPANRKKIVAASDSVTNFSGTGPSGSFRGNDFRKAYAPGVNLTGTGQSVGLLQFDGYYPADITQYATQAGIKQVPLQNVYLDGFDGTPGSENGEVALDIEMVMAMAPGLTKIIVYEGGPNGYGNDILNRIATDNSVKQISASWSFGADATTTRIFQQMAAQGQTYLNASGDSDAYTGIVAKPCDNPYVTVVGGTTLSMTAGAWTDEVVWNWGDGTGSGGGYSTSYVLPSWQQGISMVANQGATNRRNLPDVAMCADNVYVISDNGQAGFVGGTSCAAPLWAGFMALVNQQAASLGQSPIGFLNPSIYALGKGAAYPLVFHDVISGNNAWTLSSGKFNAVPGYDLCTGWGSPNGAAFINALAPPPQATPFAIAHVPSALGQFDLSFPTVAGQTYTVQCTTNLAAPVWSKVQTVTGTGLAQSVTNTKTAPQCFYRVTTP